MTAAVGRDPQHYTDSTPGKCESCDIAVWIGPRQLGAIEAARDVGLTSHVTCMVCAALQMAETDDPTLMHLGNPEGDRP